MYNEFAAVYDRLICDVDYEKWADYYFKIFRRYGLVPHLGLDLGCGTGSMTIKLSERGIDMTGVDMSEDMLSIANEKSVGKNILYLNQEMSDLELYGTVDFVVSGLDCVNYVTDKRKLLKTFKLVNNYLNPGGIFIFDINTRYKLENILGDNTYVLEDDDVFLTWQNEFDKRKGMCDFYLSFFCRKGEFYQRFDEQQTQRAYSISDIEELLTKSGMRLLSVYDDLSFEKPKKDSKRLFFVAQEQGKTL